MNTHIRRSELVGSFELLRVSGGPPSTSVLATSWSVKVLEPEERQLRRASSSEDEADVLVKAAFILWEQFDAGCRCVLKEGGANVTENSPGSP